MPDTVSSAAPPRRLSRRAALRPDRLLAALPPFEPPPPAGLRAPDAAVLQGGDPALPPLSVIVYNRLAFGPRPGDLAAFNALGGNDDARLTSWVDSQLNPNGISDTNCDNLLAGAGLPSLNKSLPQLWADYYVGNQGRTQPINDIREATMLRAVYSKRQLKEVLADFWHNHFSVYAWDYGYASATWVHYDRDVIRANLLGNFRTMLGSVTKSTAMLYYLDNYINQVAGFNENFARECHELHTLGAENYLGVVNPLTVPKENGVAIGYCDNDVYEAARCFTGWRVNNGYWGAPGNDGSFYYQDGWHDKANKLYMGQYLPSSQASDPLKDGNDVLDLLANHPGTARFIARKLCCRLISDDPPQSIVDAAAAVFSANTNAGDQLKKVVRAICLSAEFKAAWGQKFKRPFEAAAGMLRATNADCSNPDNSFWWYYESAGQPLFARRSPDGYPDNKSVWANTTALMQRWRFANILVRDDLGNVTVNLLGQMPGGLTTPNQIADFWIARLLGRAMDPAANRQEIVRFIAQGVGYDNPLAAQDIADRLPHMVALILMAPDFQWR
ncbi:MAG: DUF1800 domain-containing protein [Anaerolineales bacterium]|nr:DUF1800 domain-containing protein [Anaerolineales bacterium]